MKYIRSLTALLLVLCLCVSLASCGGAGSGSSASDSQSAEGTVGQESSGLSSQETEQPAGEKILRVGSAFAYPSLDAHKDYNGWGSSLYGLTETLFKLGDNASLEPWLAESAQADGNTWTITLKEDVAFSNGVPFTAGIAVENLQRAGQLNQRFAQLKDYAYTVVNDRTFTVAGDKPVPTLPNTLACPELGMMDLENSEDLDNAPIGTGPFVVRGFAPEQTVTVVKNTAYWGGDVALDGAEFLYMPDDSARLMAMQNGEIDCDNGVTAAAMEVFQADLERYTLYTVPATRLQFYILNANTMSANLRRAVNLTVDSEAMAEYLQGTITPTDGPFSSGAAYGKAQKPAPDPEKAKSLLEEDGYVMGADGYYEKDGQPLTLRLDYYASRSLDTLATLMQEQLKAVGIQVELICEEDPDATYIATGDFDLALYCMIADQSGDPEYFLSSTLADGAYFNVGGFQNQECWDLLAELAQEIDAARRAGLANQAVQISIDEDAFGYVALFNKITVLREGVSGFSEASPYDIYGLTAATDIQ